MISIINTLKNLKKLINHVETHPKRSDLDTMSSISGSSREPAVLITL
jgi:hypothetical protein